VVYEQEIYIRKSSFKVSFCSFWCISNCTL